ncbi:MAG: hypothetical protein ACRD1P_10160 [Thermoanaerobaculia bacterium]
MIAFASLFLGLVVGVLPVRVIVGESVARVELELDATPVGRMEGKPWSVSVDFGSELSPHELVARAIDEKGQELGRARQWINLPRPPAEVEVLLERDETGRATAARLVWGSLLGSGPKASRVSLDGRALSLDESGRAALPAYDAATTHILSADIEFSNGVRSRSDIVLGGGSAGEAKSELTAVPVRLGEGRTFPPISRLQGRFVKHSQPLSVAAVEKEPADVLVVKDLETTVAIRHLGRVGGGARGYGADGFPRYDPNTLRDMVRLGKQDRIRIIWPVARRITDVQGTAELFEQSHDFRAKDGGFHWLLTQVDYPGARAPARRFADAAAVAGLHAFSGYSRRAVVVVLADTPDHSLHAPGTVRRYLERIRVPLFIWSLGSSVSRKEWGAVEDISSPARLEEAVKRLRQELESQWVVWLEGRHLPQEITLEQRGDEIAIVR